jgi:flagellar motor switch protein FliN
LGLIMSEFMHLEKLQTFHQSFGERSGEIFRTVINMATKISLEELLTADAENLAALATEERVRIVAPYSKGLPGQLVFLMSKSFTAKVVDFMIMGDGKVEFMPEEHLDGIVEAINQVMGNESIYLSDRLGVSVRSDVKPADQVESDAIVSEYADWLLARFKVVIEDQEPAEMWTLMHPDSAVELGKMLDSAGSTPAPEVEEEPPAAEAPIPEMPASVPGMSATPPPAAPLTPPPAAPVQEPIQAQKAEFTQFGSPPSTPAGPLQGMSANEMGRVMDLDLPIVIELGRTKMLIKDILELGPGSIIELNKLVGEPVDLYVNDKKFAMGEVVVIDENFGVRITDLVPQDMRMNASGR